jgi:hypothetical protein
MKKLAVLMMIPALAMFMVPAPASANWYYWWGIQGTWQMSASGSCLHSSMPYVPNLSPISPTNPAPKNWWTAPGDSNVYAGVTVADGTWTFESTGWLTGTGTYSQRIYATILPGGAATMPVQTPGGVISGPVPLEVRVIPPLLVPQPPVVAFTYEITQSGDIVITEAAPVGVNAVTITHRGSISIDRNTMTLLTANQPVNYGTNLFANTICNFSRTLIKVSNQVPD